MDKYFPILKASLQQEIAYKVSLIVWRVRNLIGIIIVYFLWDSVFNEPGKVLFGYDRVKMLTYVFTVILVKALVLSSKSTEVSGEIGRGDLSNYLLKPVNYFKFWFMRDLSSKILNLGFAAVEFSILFVIFKPEFYIQKDPLIIVSFLISLCLGVLIYFLLSFIVSALPFWAPDLGWGSHFLVTVVFVEFLSGALFPLDVFPLYLQKIIFLTPFPYLLFFPVQIYFGSFDSMPLVFTLLIPLFWVIVLYLTLSYVWKEGLKSYQAYGR